MIFLGLIISDIVRFISDMDFIMSDYVRLFSDHDYFMSEYFLTISDIVIMLEFFQNESHFPYRCEMFIFLILFSDC